MPISLLERIRLRMPENDGDHLNFGDDLPLKKRIKLTPLRWDAEPPVRVAFWPDTSHRAMSAYYFAMFKIEKALKHPGFFKVVDINSGVVQIACGERVFEDDTDLDSLFSKPVPGFLTGGGESGMPPRQEKEMGECFHRWDKDTGIIGGTNLMIDADPEVTHYELCPVALHEMIHGLGIGHDLQSPGSAMYDKFGDVRYVGKFLAAAIAELWGLPDPRKI